MLEMTNPHLAGLLPEFFDLEDPRPAKTQLNETYEHGGGFTPLPGFKLHQGPEGCALEYPGDPLFRERCRGQLRDETIVLFDYSWLAIIQPDGRFEVCRCD